MSNIFSLLRAPKSKPGGYLLIKRWGGGFWADVDMVVTHLLAAESMKRTPVVQWGIDGPYADGKSDSFNLYFEPVSDISASELVGSIYPKNWNANNILDDLPFAHTGQLHETFGAYHLFAEKANVPKADRRFKYLRRRHEDIVVAYCWEYADRIIRTMHSHSSVSTQDIRVRMLRDRLHLKPDLQKEIAAYRANNLEGHRVMSLHLRGSDKIYENPALYAQNEAAFKLSRDWIEDDQHNLIFLATDSADYVNRWKAAFGEDKIKLQDCLRSEHEMPNFLREGSDGYRNGCEIILDTYIAAGCDHFVGNFSSNVAKYIAAIGQFPPERLHLLDQ